MWYIIRLTLWLSHKSFPSHTHFLVLFCTSDNDFRDFTQGWKILSYPCVREGGGYSDIFIRRLGFFLFIFFFVFFFFFFFFGGGGGWGVRKMKKKWGLTIFWVITNWTIFRGHFYAFKDLFLRLRYRMGDIFWGC